MSEVERENESSLPRALEVRLRRALWRPRLQDLPPWQARGLYMLQVLYATGRELAGGLPTLRAMGLVYTTMLSLVPLLAFSFSVLKGFGVHNQLQPMLSGLLSPLGASGEEIALTIVGFVDRVQVGVLGAVGLGLLVFTVISLLKKIEMAFNYTWRVSEFRALTHRISNYLSVALVGPLLVFMALGITASLGDAEVLARVRELPGVGILIALIGRLTPYVLVIAAFTFIYVVFPHTKVRLRSALTGAVIAGVLWESVGWAFSSFLGAWSTQTAVYSSFAVLFIFMVWLHLNWLILLTGATIAFYHQHPEHMHARKRPPRLSCRLLEQMALLVMTRVARTFATGGASCTTAHLARELNAPLQAVQRVLAILEGNGLLTQTRDAPPRWLPARAPERISLYEILRCARSDGEGGYLNKGELSADPVVDRFTEAVDSALEKLAGQHTLDDLIAEEPPPVRADGAAAG